MSWLVLSVTVPSVLPTSKLLLSLTSTQIMWVDSGTLLLVALSVLEALAAIKGKSGFAALKRGFLAGLIPSGL